jgi:putative flippase GtrA
MSLRQRANRIHLGARAHESSSAPRSVAVAAVGLSAVGVHFAVVLALVPAGVPPLAANVAGFLAAFAASVVGHVGWTFHGRHRNVGIALRRFAVVSVGGFLLNEANYAALLADTVLDYRVALLLILAAVAALTSIAVRDWAFADL